MPSQQLVVLASPNNWIFFMHLHRLLAIFTPPYYYIYNDVFSVIYWTERCNLGITQDLRQIYAKFSKKIYKFFLWISDIIEKYIKLFTNVIKLFTNLQIYKRKKRRQRKKSGLYYRQCSANRCIPYINCS